MKNKEIEQIPELTKVSSKGQVVIPIGIRKKMGIKSGSVFAMMSPRKDMLVLKRLDNRILEEDLATLKKVEKAWEDIEKGRFRVASKREFLEEIKKW